MNRVKKFHRYTIKFLYGFHNESTRFNGYISTLSGIFTNRKCGIFFYPERQNSLSFGILLKRNDCHYMVEFYPLSADLCWELRNKTKDRDDFHVFIHTERNN